MQRLQQIAIRRLRVLPVPSGGGVSVMHKLTMLAEFSRLGVRVVNPEALDVASPELFLDYRGIITTLVEMQESRVAYEPLFPGFPGELPRENDNFVYPLIDYVAAAPGPGAADAGVVLEFVSPEEAVRRLRVWLKAEAASETASAGESREAGSPRRQDARLVRKLLGPPVRKGRDDGAADAVRLLVSQAV